MNNRPLNLDSNLNPKSRLTLKRRTVSNLNIGELKNILGDNIFGFNTGINTMAELTNSDPGNSTCTGAPCGGDNTCSKEASGCGSGDTGCASGNFPETCRDTGYGTCKSKI